MNSLSRILFRTGCSIIIGLSLSQNAFAASKSKAQAKASSQQNVFKVKSLSVNGKKQAVSQDIQAKLLSGGNAPVSGTLCVDKDCLGQLQLITQGATTQTHKNSFCDLAQKLQSSNASASFLAQISKTQASVCKTNSSKTLDVVKSAIKDIDLISKDNQGNLDVQAGAVDIVLAPVVSAAADDTNDDQAPVVVQCPTGQVLGEGNKCYTPAVNPCPAGQYLGEDKKCHLPSAPKCPAGQAISEGSGKCEVIQPRNPRTEG